MRAPKEYFENCICGDAKAVERHLRNGVDPNASDATENEGRFIGTVGQTGLMLACGSPSVEVVDLLLKAGADPNCVNPNDGRNAFYYAIVCGTLGQSRFMEQKVIKEKETIPVVRKLLECGANPNALTEKNGCAAFELCMSQQVYLGETARLLLNGGAKPKDGAASIRNAASKNDLEIAESLLLLGYNQNDQSHRDRMTALFYAKSEEMTKLLLKHGAKINVADCHGETLLMSAACSGNTVLVQVILEKRALLNEVDDNGKTAVDYCKGKSAQKVRQCLAMIQKAGGKPASLLCEKPKTSTKTRTKK